MLNGEVIRLTARSAWRRDERGAHPDRRRRIAGLAMALTLHQIGVPFHVFEASREMKPLGVGHQPQRMACGN